MLAETKNQVPTLQQMEMMKHAWGYREKIPGYRTHYCTELNDPVMCSLVKLGFFREPIGMGTVGENCGIFHLTDKAVDLLRHARAYDDYVAKEEREKKKEAKKIQPEARR